MGVRGRKSFAALEIKNPSVVSRIERPDAPYDLTDEEAEEWWAVVNRLPAEWFPRETHALLSQYCRHKVQAKRVATLVEKMQADAEGFCIRDYDRLLKMQERESRCIASLATKMRISQQTTYDKSRKKGEGGVRKPWES